MGIRLVSYNVRYFSHALRGIASTKKGKLGISEAIAALQPRPEVVCLQEVETISLRSRIAYRRQNGEETQLQSFMRALEAAFAARSEQLPYEAYYFRAHTVGSPRMPIYTTGLVMLVDRRLRVERHNQAEPQKITHAHVQMWRDRKQTRICAHMRLITDDGRPLHVFNTHLSLPTPFARQFWAEKLKMGWGKNQLAEAETLRRFVRAQAGDEPFLVCGDFNSAPGSPVYRHIVDEGHLVGAQEKLGLIDCTVPKGFPTAGVARLRMHLDHVFCSPQVQILDMEGTRRFGDREGPFHGLSDHVPLIVHFDV
jgi:endonuclease/exonuclease/phosphatase family metal-dependent hydrolase